LSFTCNYLYPRVEYYEVRRLVESGEQVLVVGLRGSGVSTILSLISRLSEAKYEILDFNSIREALEAVQRYPKAVVGATGSLRELLEVLVKPPQGLNMVVVKPLTPSELEEYLSTLGVTVARRTLLYELYYRSGGLPGEICRAVVERGLFGRTLDEEDVLALPEEPRWVNESRGVMGSDFDRLMLHSTLAIIPKALSSKVEVEGSWWLVDMGVDYRIPADMLWLQGFALRLVDRDKAVRLLEEALAVDMDSFARYIHSSALYRLTRSRGHARVAVETALNIIDGTQDPLIKYNLALSSLEIAEQTEPPWAYIRLLTTLIENAPLTQPIEARELASMLSKAKARVVDRDSLKAYIDLLHVTGLRLSAQRLINELEIVLSDLEDIAMKLGIPGDLRRYAENIYLKIQAVKSANVGQWRETLRLSLESLERGGADSQVLSLLAIALCFVGLQDQLSLRALKTLDARSEEDRGFIETLLKFCSANSVEEVRAIAKVKPEDEKDQRLVVVRLLATIASRTPLTEDYIEKIVGRGPPAALVKMLYATVRGETGKVVGMLREIPGAEDPSNPLSLISDIMVNTSSVVKRSSDMKRLAPHIALLADSLKAGRQEELARLVGEIALALKDGDSESLRIRLAKLVLYAINTYL
jgi:energy-coupling factor transporter ATP-binding protein EcfA2